MAPDIDGFTNEELGALIKQLRTNARRSPEWLADQLRLSVRTINNWESGRNRPSVADVIAYETLTKSKLSDLLKAVSNCRTPEWALPPSLFDLDPFVRVDETLIMQESSGLLADVA